MVDDEPEPADGDADLAVDAFDGSAPADVAATPADTTDLAGELEADDTDDGDLLDPDLEPEPELALDRSQPDAPDPAVDTEAAPLAAEVVPLDTPDDLDDEVADFDEVEDLDDLDEADELDEADDLDDLDEADDLDDLDEEVDQVGDEDVELLDDGDEPAAETDEIELLTEDDEAEGEVPAFQVRQLAGETSGGATRVGRGHWQRPDDDEEEDDDLQQWVAHPSTTPAVVDGANLTRAAVANAATRAAAQAAASQPVVIDQPRRHPVLRGLLVLVVALLVLAAGVGAGYLFTALSGR